MRPFHYSALAAAITLSTALAHDDGLTCHNHPPPTGPFEVFSWSWGESNSGTFRPSTGELAVAQIDASGRASWQVTILPPMRPDTIRTADLDGNGFEDIVLSSRQQSLLTVVQGQRDLSTPLSSTTHAVGPGPLGAEPVQREGASGSLLLPRVGWEVSRGGAVSETSLFNIHTGEFLASTPLNADALRAPLYTTASVSPANGGPNWFAVTWAGVHSSQACNSGIEPTVGFFTVASDSGTPLSVTRITDVTLERGPTSATGARLTGFDEDPWFVFANPLDPIVEVAQPGRAETVLHTFADPVDSIRPIDLGSHEGALIVFGDGIHGARAGIYEFDPALGFTLVEEIVPPAGESFADLLALGDGRLFARLAGSGHPSDLNYAVYRNDGNGFALVSASSDQVFGSYPATTTVKLYTDDPFGNGGFEFENFSAGNWATNASYDGVDISATSEVYDGTAAGLGNPMPVQLTPSGDPGPDGKALANQWGDASSSLFFTGSAGPAPAIAISPPAGAYSTAIQVGFSAAPGTTVIYRQTGTPWQPAPAGGFFVASDTVVEFYGQAPDGNFSPIQSAAYQIDQSLAPNPGDWIPPQVALNFGIEPGDDPDIDGDGFSNIEEILAGTDLHSPNSFPANDDWAFPPPLEITIDASLSASDGTTQPVPNGSIATIRTLSGEVLATAELDPRNAGKITLWDHCFELPASGRQPAALCELDRFAPLLVSVMVDGPTPIEIMGLVAVCPLPDPPTFRGGAPSDPAVWVEEARLAYQWMRENCRQPTARVTPLTTLATVAATSWAGKYLESLGSVKVRFPWDRSAADAIPLSPYHLELIGRPRGPAHQAYRLDEVAAAMHETLANEVAMEKLALVAEQIYLEAQRAPKVIDPFRALLAFTRNGAIHPDYDPAVTPSGPTEFITYTGLESDPDPLPVRDLAGTLLPTSDGWVLRTQIGERFALLSSDPLLVVIDGSVRFDRYAWQPATGALPGSTVRVVGFPLDPPGAPRKDGEIELEVASLEFLEADLESGITDLDGDGVEDSFELLFLGTTEYGFWDDPDGDGFSLGEELMAGTDPGNPLSFPGGAPAFPQDVLVTLFPDGSVTVTWTGSGTAIYEVQNSATLDAWQDSPIAPIEVAPGEFEWALPAPDPVPTRSFFRVAVSLD